ncbi:hypothetical protein glysoja_032470 [Glycine soja]|uniref:PMI1/PMIR1-2 C-terminal domain-containing protein n=1 Tax=Glycine soja TaxID=3848 RepID=A0A0B2PEU4_GLYSO|nr:hypothetical protein glysoja_032470 [Glycine soja]
MNSSSSKSELNDLKSKPKASKEDTLRKDKKFILCVHWKRRGALLVTPPAKVIQGVAEFQDILTRNCSIHGSRSGPHNSAKYEVKHFMLYASFLGAPGLDLGKHRVDLTRNCKECSNECQFWAFDEEKSCSPQHGKPELEVFKENIDLIKLVVCDSEKEKPEENSGNEGKTCSLVHVKPELDVFQEILETVKPDDYRLPDSGIESFKEREGNEFSVIDQGIEFSPNKRVKLEESIIKAVVDACTVDSTWTLYTDGIQDGLCTKELLLQELELALNSVSELETVAMESPNIMEAKSEYKLRKSHSLDDVTESVASGFLSMLGLDHSPMGLSFESIKPSSSLPDLQKGHLIESEDVRSQQKVSNPLVMLAEMGSGIMEILQCLASLGIEKLSMQANKLIPLEDITGKTMQQISREAKLVLEETHRQYHLQHDLVTGQDSICTQSGLKGTLSGGLESDKFSSSSIGDQRGSEFVSLEDLAPLAMDKATRGLVLVDPLAWMELLPCDCWVKKTAAVVDGIIGLSLTLDEWMRLDCGEIDDDIDNIETEPVGTPMLSLIQVERVFVPPKQKIDWLVSEAGNNNDECEIVAKVELKANKEDKSSEEEEEAIPQFRITEVHVAGLKTEPHKKKAIQLFAIKGLILMRLCLELLDLAIRF